MHLFSLMLLVLLEPNHSETFLSLWRSFGTSPPCLIPVKLQQFNFFPWFHFSLLTLPLSSAASLSLCLSSASSLSLSKASVLFPLLSNKSRKSMQVFFCFSFLRRLHMAENRRGGEVRSLEYLLLQLTAQQLFPSIMLLRCCYHESLHDSNGLWEAFWALFLALLQ